MDSRKTKRKDKQLKEEARYHALINAARDGNIPSARELIISQGVPINKITGAHITPLSTAMDNQQWDMALFLIEMGANPSLYLKGDPLVIINQARAQELLAAAREGNIENARQLMEKNVAIDPATTNSASALLTAMQNQQWSMALYLISAGANVNLSAGDCTPLILAIRYQQEDIFDQILENNELQINPKNKKGAWGNTALHEAVEQLAKPVAYELTKRMIARLLEAGAKTDAVYKSHTPLQRAHLILSNQNRDFSEIKLLFDSAAQQRAQTATQTEKTISEQKINEPTIDNTPDAIKVSAKQLAKLSIHAAPKAAPQEAAPVEQTESKEEEFVLLTPDNTKYASANNTKAAPSESTACSIM